MAPRTVIRISYVAMIAPWGYLVFDQHGATILSLCCISAVAFASRELIRADMSEAELLRRSRNAPDRMIRNFIYRALANVEDVCNVLRRYLRTKAIEQLPGGEAARIAGKLESAASDISKARRGLSEAAET